MPTRHTSCLHSLKNDGYIKSSRVVFFDYDHRDALQRCQGLLKSGVIQPVDRPIWYDVYEKFPPLKPPSYLRKKSSIKVKEILYPEDIIRARYYKTVANPGTIDLFDPEGKSRSQIFVEKYLELLAEQQKAESTTEEMDLFDAAFKALQEEERLSQNYVNEQVTSEQEFGMRRETDSFEDIDFKDIDEQSEPLALEDINKLIDSIDTMDTNKSEDTEHFFTEGKLIVDDTNDEGTKISDKEPEHQSDNDPLSKDK